MTKKYKFNEYYLHILFLLLFFIVETVSKNEILLTIFVFIFSLVFTFFPKERKVKFWLWIIGTFLGFVIEVGMGLVTRSQFWSYGSFYGVPLWLPFIWGYGFISIYLLGKFIATKTRL